ncbi:hypothetical protein GR157_33550 [Burkholderia sp. 4701]|nr:hypothetical protein [Burkholderia sp. 4701]MXN86921.1 hypothetical protein [Burkholderia sp. 4812]
MPPFEHERDLEEITSKEAGLLRQLGVVPETFERRAQVVIGCAQEDQNSGIGMGPCALGVRSSLLHS